MFHPSTGTEEGDKYFSGPLASLVSLFILTTTANNPDVMIPAYTANRWNVLFFVAYLLLTTFLILNAITALVYNNFSGKSFPQ